MLILNITHTRELENGSLPKIRKLVSGDDVEEEHAQTWSADGN